MIFLKVENALADVQLTAPRITVKDAAQDHHQFLLLQRHPETPTLGSVTSEENE